MKVYAIFGGCYSDWSVDGFFLDKEKAEKYCAIKNTSGDEYDEKYVIELNEINADVSKVEIKWHYHVTFRFRDGMWKLLDTCGDFSRKGYVGKTKKPKFMNNNPKWSTGWFKIEFTANNDDHARKIAYDYLAQYKSLLETEGHDGVEKLMNIKRP